jgi:hypothetical protein
MRFALVIASLAAIAVGLIQIRRTELTTRHEIQRLASLEVTLRRRLWDQQMEIGCLTAPQAVRMRAEAMGIDPVTAETARDLAAGDALPASAKKPPKKLSARKD